MRLARGTFVLKKRVHYSYCVKIIAVFLYQNITLEETDLIYLTLFVEVSNLPLIQIHKRFLHRMRMVILGEHLIFCKQFQKISQNSSYL